MATVKIYNSTTSSWEEVSYGSLSNIGDAKGDLIGFSADNTPVKIDGSGASDGDVLTFDSGETPGVKWSKAGTFAFMFSKTSGNITISALTTTLKSYSVTGDGVHGLLVRFYYLLQDSATNARGGRIFFDGSQVLDNLTIRVGDTVASQGWVYIPPWSGAKTVLLQHRAQDSAGTVYSSTANPITFSGQWVRAVTVDES